MNTSECTNYTDSYLNHNVFNDGVGLYGEFIGEQAFLHRIFVADEDTGKGYGLKMMRKFEAEAINRSCTTIRLGAISNLNARDLTLLKKFGFNLIDKKNEIYEKKL